MNVRATTTGRAGVHRPARGSCGAGGCARRILVRLVRYADEPDFREIRYEVLSQQTFPEYLQNNVPGNKYWGRLYEDFPDFQLGLVDGDELVAELHSVPTPWDGTDEDLPAGWDEAFLNAFESGREPTVLSRARDFGAAGPSVARAGGEDAGGDAERRCSRRTA